MGHLSPTFLLISLFRFLSLYQSPEMAQVYEEGIHPINQDLDMATQLRMIHGPDVTAWMDPNLFPN